MNSYISDFNVSKPGAVALEDSIMKKGSLTTAGSKILNNFVAPFNATVVDRLHDGGMQISGKTHMGEFGIRGLVTDNQEGVSGSAQVVASNSTSYCLCNDLFGLYRREAAENGLYYIHPTYGTVSRYGLIPLASSMDQIGILCKELASGFSLLSIISGHDFKDGAMFPDKSYSYKKVDKTITICAPSQIVERADTKTQDAIRTFTEKFTVVDDSLDYFDVYKQVMYVLSCAEISNNINRYDGIKFGYRFPNSETLESLYTKTRTEALGLETKLTAIMGAMVLSADKYIPYYEKAMKIRRLMKQALCFDKYDIIILPVSISDSAYENLSLYAISALLGLPSISFSYRGCGIQLIAGARNEDALLTAWEVFGQ